MCEAAVEFFAGVPINEDILDKRPEKIAATSLSDERHLKFEVTATNEAIDLSKSYVLLKVKIVKADGGDIGDNDEVAFVNYAAATIFEKLEISLGSAMDNVVNMDNYQYISYLESKLQHSNDYKNTCGTLSGYYDDTPKHFDTLGDANLGFKARKEMCKKSRTFQLVSKIHSGLINQPKPLKSQIDMNFEFTLSQPDFFIMAPELTDQNTQKYQVKILEAHLVIDRLLLSNECNIRTQKNFENNPIEYQFDRSKMWLKEIDTGLSSIVLSDFCDKNELPKFMICGFIAEKSFSGRCHLNPFHIIQNKVKSLNLTKNGTSITGKRLAMDYAKGNFSESYHQFLKSFGFWDNLEPCSLMPDDFLHGTTVYGFDLGPTCNGLNYVDQIRQGNMEMEIVFDGDTDQKTKFFILNIYDSQLSINSLLRINKNYTS